jgi:hypothetical protein
VLKERMNNNSDIKKGVISTLLEETSQLNEMTMRDEDLPSNFSSMKKEKPNKFLEADHFVKSDEKLTSP